MNSQDIVRIPCLSWWLVATMSMAAVMSSSTMASAETRHEPRYQVGLRSALIIQTLPLSDIDPAFSDLSVDGISGPHYNTAFFMARLKPYLRVGLETLIGNSDYENTATTINFQGSGPVIEVDYRRDRFTFAGGVHTGLVLFNVMNREQPAAESGVNSGTYYKSAALFFAPYVAVGVSFGAHELRLFAKYKLVGPGAYDHKGVFNAPSIGLGWGLSL